MASGKSVSTEVSSARGPARFQTPAAMRILHSMGRPCIACTIPMRSTRSTLLQVRCWRLTPPSTVHHFQPNLLASHSLAARSGSLVGARGKSEPGIQPRIRLRRSSRFQRTQAGWRTMEAAGSCGSGDSAAASNLTISVAMSWVWLPRDHLARAPGTSRSEASRTRSTVSSSCRHSPASPSTSKRRTSSRTRIQTIRRHKASAWRR